MDKPSAASAVTPTAALIAKAAFRRLAMERLEPTPDNYARAWREEGGVLLQDVTNPLQQAQEWADLLDRATRLLDRSTRLWPSGRRRESLQRVLSSSRSDPQRLLQRLRQLVGSWDGEAAAPEEAGAAPVAEAIVETLPATDTVASAAAPLADVPVAEAAAHHPVWPQIVHALEATVQAALPPDEVRAQEVGNRLRLLAGHAAPVLAEMQEACADVRRVLQHRHHLVDQLGGLVRELTDGLGDLAEDNSWVEGQCLAMRSHLDLGLTSRGVSAVSQLLVSTRERQQQLRVERTQARESLKQLIHTMLQDIGELGTHTGRFNDNVGRYAEVIGEADSLESLAGVVREMVEETRTVHTLVSHTTQRLQDEHARASEMSQRVHQLEDELRQLSQEVSTDQLTQVANRRGLITRFDAERSRAEREGATLAVGILDIDNFKRLNDTLGHQTGDEALKFLARRVTEALRPTDTLARYGGEEFVVLLPATPVDEAQRVLTRVQRQLSAELFMYENRQAFVTFSAGVTPYRLGETIEAALQRADEALYEAKRTGKNRTCMS